jgi:hypothetical protein
MAHAFRYLILSVVLTASAFAQTRKLQTVRFAVFAARPIANVTFVPGEGVAPVKLAFYPTTRSPRYEWRGTMPVRFVDAATGEAVAEATIPAEIHDALLLFSPIEPAPKTGLRYRISVLDDGAARHSAGGLAIVNFSGLELSGTVGSHAVLLKPGLNPTLAIGQSARIALRAAFKNKTYSSYNDQVEMRRSERVLLILFPPYYAGSLEAQSRVLIDEPPVVPASPR